MDRASDSGSEGWGFESLPVYQIKEEIPNGISSFIRSAKGLERSVRNSPVDCCLPPAGWRQHLYFAPTEQNANESLPVYCLAGKVQTSSAEVLLITVDMNHTCNLPKTLFCVTIA